MNITLRQLQALTALVRAGSFTRAAESLHVTQSALSGLIKELETQMGVRLVDRQHPPHRPLGGGARVPRRRGADPG
ncbi:HTH-type transcriptional regulator ArgP [Castellaniella defragrans]